jgi:hypothetical protein
MEQDNKDALKIKGSFLDVINVSVKGTKKAAPKKKAKKVKLFATLAVSTVYLTWLPSKEKWLNLSKTYLPQPGISLALLLLFILICSAILILLKTWLFSALAACSFL